MSDGSEKSGFYVSGAMHAALLGLLVVGFSQAPKFDDAAELIPVDTITQSQFNEIMHGERDAKPSKTPPSPPQRQLAVVDPTPPTPPEPPAGPAPRRRYADAARAPATSGQSRGAADPPAASGQARAAAAPPRQAPAAQAFGGGRARASGQDQSRRKAAGEAEAGFAGKAGSRTRSPRCSPRRRRSRRQGIGQGAAKPPSKPFDPNAIAKLIGQTKLADATPTSATPQGLPTQHSARMSPSLSASLDAWFTEAYLACWSPPPTTPEGRALYRGRAGDLQS